MRDDIHQSSLRAALAVTGRLPIRVHALFFGTVHDVIIPRLQELGIPALRARDASYVLEGR